jgi:hypothetical protein
MGVTVGMGIAVGFADGVGGRGAVDMGAAICAPVQPENARHKTIETIIIRSYLILIIASRGGADECLSWKLMATQRQLQPHVGQQSGNSIIS